MRIDKVQAIEQLQRKIDALRGGEKTMMVEPRLVFNALGYARRSKHAWSALRRFLDAEELDLTPYPDVVWIDEPVEMTIRHVRATRKSDEDPIRRVGLMEASQNEPRCVSPTTKLAEAITIMLGRSYSQLPVTNNGLKNVQGCISWRSIAKAVAKGVTSDVVKDYVTKDFRIVLPECPFLSVVDMVRRYEFVLIEDKSHTLKGIVTLDDIIAQYREWSEAYLLLGEIEEHIRVLTDDKFTPEELQAICQEPERVIQNVDDLTQGEYQRLLSIPEYWDRLNLKQVDRTLCVKALGEVREIRNDVMHFLPDGLEPDQMETLRRVVGFLRDICS